MQPPRLKCFEQNWELLISHQFYNVFSSGLPETSVVIKKVRSNRSLSVHCMLLNIQVCIQMKYSIHWTNTVDSFIKRQDLPLEVKIFFIFCLLPSFHFGMGLLVPVILTQHAESLCKPNQQQRTFLAYSLAAGRCCQAVAQDTAHIFLHHWFSLQLTQHGHTKPQQQSTRVTLWKLWLTKEGYVVECTRGSWLKHTNKTRNT